MATGNVFGKRASLDRRQFWIWIGALVAVQIALIAFWNAYPEMVDGTSSLASVLMIFVAMAVGARFKDIGWKRWVGITVALFIVFILPLVLFTMVYVSGQIGPAPDDGPPAIVWYLSWSRMAFLLVLIVIAGVRPSKIDAGAAQVPGLAHP